MNGLQKLHALKIKKKTTERINILYQNIYPQ